MKKIVIAGLLYSFAAGAAYASPASGDATESVGINWGTYGVLGIQGEFNISSMTNNAPVSLQAFLKNYIQNIGPGNSWDTTGIGAAAIYDFNTVAKLDKKIHPYGGIGLMTVHHSWNGTGPERLYTGVAGGLYLTGGVRYDLNSKVAADLNYNVFGGLTAGIIFSF